MRWRSVSISSRSWRWSTWALSSAGGRRVGHLVQRLGVLALAQRHRLVALVADDIERAALDLVVDAADVPAGQPESDQLQPANHQDQDRHRAEARQVAAGELEHDDDRDRDERDPGEQ